jgi:beta-galactosidase/beta-glucuronidase
MKTLCKILASLFLFSSIGNAASSPRESAEIKTGWRFQMDGADIGEKEKWYDVGCDRSAWAEVSVPKAWDLYDEALWGYEGIGWYTTSIPASMVRSGKLQTLRFGRVNYQAKVWLNGELLGENIGGYLPFEFDVTGKLKPDSDNVLVLRVDNKPRLEWLPAAKEIEWVQYGGLIAPVTLETAGTVHIADLAINAVPKGSGASIECALEVRNAGQAERNVTLRIGVSGEKDSWLSIPLKLAAATTATPKVSLSLEHAKPWSPESPFLYSIEAEIDDGTSVLDAKSDRFGVRRIETRGREILLNGERFRVKGVNRYDEYGRYGSNPPRDLLIADLRQMKKAGINFIRVHYPQSPDLLSLYDEMGFVMMEEVPINWWGEPFEAKGDPLQSEAILPQAIRTLEGMIRRDKNHPCLIIWSMANESRTDSEVGIGVMRRLIRRTKELDTSRLVTFVTTGGDVNRHKAYEDADLIATNIYYGVFGPPFALHSSQLEDNAAKPSADYLRSQLGAYPAKPMIVSEFGNRGVPGVHGDVAYSEDFQAAYIQSVWKAIQSVDEVSGGVLWCWADYYHRRNFIQYAVFGPYGVVTVDRKPKAALRALTSMYTGK